MKQKLRIAGMIFVLVTMCLTTSSMAESPCRQRLFKICQEDQEAMICRLLSYDEPETVESVSVFLREIGVLDEDVQKDLICARLLGRKKFLNIGTVLYESADSGGECDFQSGIAKFRFKIADADYPELIEAHRKLEKLKLCPKKNISFDIEGMVEDADAEYSGSSLKSFVLKLEGVKFSNVTTPYAKGGFDIQRKPLKKKIDEEYQRYFKAGTSKKEEPKEKEKPKTGQTPGNLKTYTNSIGMEFVLVPAGSSGEDTGKGLFECGDKSSHKVTITKAFYISRYEVTQGQWKAVMGNNPSQFQNCGDKCPVENVSWDDTQEFIAKMNLDSARFPEGERPPTVGERSRTYRLPTEAEWEYAARAGSDT
ncbi:MAG: hypothetical protein BWK80_41570, partial [Desulfobacteraceae bacterium IS3]